MRPRRSPKKRFWAKVTKTASCWNWTASLAGRGYGQFWDGESVVYAHRFCWKLFFGPIPLGLYICHHCDNMKCVRPSHLFLGTPKDNLTDASKKGRMIGAKGERSARSKFGVDEVLNIYAKSKAGVSALSLARTYNVTRSCIYKILKGERWQHVKIA